MSAWGASWGGAWGFKSFGESFGASFGDSWGHCSWGDDAPPVPPVVPPVIGAGGNRIRFVGQKLPEVSDDIYLKRRRDDEDILFVLS